MRDEVRPAPIEPIDNLIRLVRGQKVMLDSDLAALYGVETFNLNKAVHRNQARFPPDFMFQLTREEYEALRFQIGILETGRGRHRKYLPYVFTEQGVAMLSSVLRSPRAIQMNVAIMRAFVRLREVLGANKEFAGKLAELERKLATHDTAIREIVDAIRRLAVLPPPEPEKPPIGFMVREMPAPYRRRRLRVR